MTNVSGQQENMVYTLPYE